MAIPIVPIAVVAGISYLGYNAEKISRSGIPISRNLTDAIKALEKPLIFTAAAFAVWSYTNTKK